MTDAALPKATMFNRTLLGLEELAGRELLIVSGAFLDDVLADLVQTAFVSQVESRVVEELLLSPSSPLGTFSARIDIALLLGLIPAEVHRELHIVRTLRNDAAHLSSVVDLESPGRFRDRIAALTYWHHPLSLGLRVDGHVVPVSKWVSFEAHGREWTPDTAQVITDRTGHIGFVVPRTDPGNELTSTQRFRYAVYGLVFSTIAPAVAQWFDQEQAINVREEDAPT